MIRSLVRSVILAVGILALIGVPAMAQSEVVAELSGCGGVANAYAHVAGNALSHPNRAHAAVALAAVAQFLGCDLSAVAPITSPGGTEQPGRTNLDEQARADENNDQDADEINDQDADENDEQARADENDDQDTDENNDEGRADTGGHGPNNPNWQAKCDRIASKLTEAQARPHGKSADAFARQADRWECPSN